MPRLDPELDEAAAVGAGLDALDTPQDAAQRPSLARRIGWVVLPPVAFLVLVVAVWQALWAAAIWPEYQLPAPLKVWDELSAQFSTGAARGRGGPAGPPGPRSSRRSCRGWARCWARGGWPRRGTFCCPRHYPGIWRG